MNRRFFLKSGGIALASVGVSLSAPSFLERVVMGREALAGGRRKVLIAIFQRGAVDGLNMVVPFGETDYYNARPSIAIPKPDGGSESAINLDGFFASDGAPADVAMRPDRTSMRRTTWSRRRPV